MLSGIESAGVVACIEVLGVEHPVAIKLRAWLDVNGSQGPMNPQQQGATEEMMDGAAKAVEFCQEQGLPIVNLVDVRRYVEGRESQSSAPEGVDADLEESVSSVGGEV